jgi:hypothetical protein
MKEEILENITRLQNPVCYLGDFHTGYGICLFWWQMYWDVPGVEFSF